MGNFRNKIKKKTKINHERKTFSITLLSVKLKLSNKILAKLLIY